MKRPIPGPRDNPEGEDTAALPTVPAVLSPPNYGPYNTYLL